MAQHSHVPKFGNWDKDNIPYTTYFENARRDKAGVRMNPNDPEENPEAFMFLKGGMESDGYCYPVQAPLHVNSNKSISGEKYYAEGYWRHNAPQRNTSDHQKSGGYKSITSESGSDKNSSDYSRQHPGHQHAKSHRKNGLNDGGNSFSASVSGHSRQRSGSYQSDDTYHRAASIPKFGAWDEADPKSGEGFTVIFNKVKEEKQIAYSNFPTVPPQPSNYSDSQVKRGRSSSKSKICCCLFPQGSD